MERTTSIETLYDMCCYYIENAQYESTEPRPDEKIYDMCCDYINARSETPQSTIDKLREHFKF